MTLLTIDTDPGIDDALALLLALRSSECSVEAVTTVAGNVPLVLATRNARHVLALAVPSRPPAVVPGADRPLARELVTAVQYHGADGLGGALRGAPAPERVDEPGPDAPRAIIEMARRLGAVLTIVALGPLTNIARSLELDALALGRVGRLVVMGGAVDVPGNVTPEAEFNMHVDPEAAERVLAAGLPLDLVPLDVTHRVVLHPAALEPALSQAPDRIARFVSAMTKHAFRVGAAGPPGLPLHDPLAVGIALDPSFVTFEPVRLAIGSGGETRREWGTPNCRVAVAVDADRFLPWFLERLCRASS
jgi:purine nucleosidase/pyrimidine-specific ribonucleoside hydrolase